MVQLGPALPLVVAKEPARLKSETGGKEPSPGLVGGGVGLLASTLVDTSSAAARPVREKVDVRVYE